MADPPYLFQILPKSAAIYEPKMNGQQHARVLESDMAFKLPEFWTDESGAVTVDWVILAAGVIGLALASMGVVIDGTEDLSGDVEATLSSQLISTSF